MHELASSPAMLAAIIESSEDAIISKNLDSIIMSWNPSAERLFGYKAAEAIGKHIFLIIPPELRNEEEMIIASLKQGRRIEHFQTERVTKEGRIIPISLTISPIRNKDGVVIGASKIARDISKEKRSEALTTQYSKTLETINAVSKKINAQLEYRAILQVVTDAATELTGAAFGAFFANKTDQAGNTYQLYAISGVSKEAFDKFQMPRNTALFQKTFSGTGVFRSDNILKEPSYGHNAPHLGMPKGHLPVVSYLAVPVIASSKIVLGGLFLGHPKEAVFKKQHELIGTAIASHAAIALQNAQLYEDLASLSNKKDQFIAIASHELKTPLTTLSGYLQMLTQYPENLPEFLPKLNNQVTRLQRMINNMLDVSKIRAGKVELSLGNCSLIDLIKDAVNGIDLKGHPIEVLLPTEDFNVFIDKDKINQVITNLLANAVKYSPPDSEIRLICSKITDRIEIVIQDQGSGIPAEHREKIFSQFYRIPSSQKSEGAGLGLFICKEIVDLHRGKIWVESSPGKGAAFYVQLPMHHG